jgi:hypothetical protein
MQRGYMMGLRRARTQAQREMNEMADEFEGALAEIHAEMRGERGALGAPLLAFLIFTGLPKEPS